MKQKCFFYFLLLSASLYYSQTVIDDFTDGNFTSNQIWTGSSSEFSIITDSTLPNGNASTDGSYLASNTSEGDISLAFSSNEVSEWRFSLGSPNFNTSSQNYIGVVLMANASFSGDMRSNNFQGYYVRIGNNASDLIELWRKRGSTDVKIDDFPSSPSYGTGALRDGLNIRVTRSSSGVFELFYSIGFQNNSVPTKSAGTITNNVYSTSSYFGVYQNINNPSSDRRVYIDNIELGAVTWDGSTSNNWDIATNWDIDLIPSPSDNVIIPSGLSNYPTTSGAVSVNSLTINYGATLISTNSFSANSVTYSRNLANGSQWYMMSSPVVGETYDDVWNTSNSIGSGANTNMGVAWYDNTTSDTDTDGNGTDTATGNWRYFQNGTTTGTFSVGKGYGIYRNSAGRINFSGTNIHTSDQTFEVIQGVSKNFNLIGNPFTSFLNLGDFLEDNGTGVISGAQTWFWNGSSYDVKTLGVHASYEIAPGQGFFVEAAANTNVTFDISDVSHQSSDTFQRTSHRPEITLIVSEGSNSRNAYIYYIDGARKGFDLGYDGYLFNGAEDSLSIYSDLVESDGKEYQLQSLPNNDFENLVIPIGVYAASGKEITFTAIAMNLPTDLKVFLEDRETNTFNRLDKAGSNYKLTLTNPLSGIGRFYLHTSQSALSLKNVVFDNVRIYNTDVSTLKIVGLQPGNTKLSVYDMHGKQLINISFAANEINDVALPKISKGVYVVQLETEVGKLNTKIIIE